MPFPTVIGNNWRAVLSALIFVVAFTSCETEKEPALAVDVVQEAIEPILYEEFTPISTKMPTRIDIIVNDAYVLDSFILVSGHDPIMDCGQFIVDDTINGWGKRLYAFDIKNELIFKSKGRGELYLYRPHFYRNEVNDKVYIICQLSYEFWLGGDLFLFENGTIKYIGNIDVEGADMETSLIDIIKIQETKDETTFTFKRDSVTLYPGGDPEIVPSKGLSYVYKNDSFTLHRR